MTAKPLQFSHVPFLLVQFYPQRCYFLQITSVFFRISVQSAFLSCLQFFNFSFQFYIRQTRHIVHIKNEDKIGFRHFSMILENSSCYLIKVKHLSPFQVLKYSLRYHLNSGKKKNLTKKNNIKRKISWVVLAYLTSGQSTQ